MRSKTTKNGNRRKVTNNILHDKQNLKIRSEKRLMKPALENHTNRRKNRLGVDSVQLLLPYELMSKHVEICAT